MTKCKDCAFERKEYGVKYCLKHYQEKCNHLHYSDTLNGAVCNDCGKESND